MGATRGGVRLGIVLCGLVLLAGACGKADIEAKAVTATQAETLRFTGTTIEGKAYDASELTGKPVVLWFWAPWCATCASEAQSINDLRAEYGDRLGILGIAGMGGNKEMREFVSDLEVKNVNLDDQEGVLWKKFGITEQSTYVLVDPKGTVVTKSYLDDLQLTDKVKTLVG